MILGGHLGRRIVESRDLRLRKEIGRVGHIAEGHFALLGQSRAAQAQAEEQAEEHTESNLFFHLRALPYKNSSAAITPAMGRAMRANQLQYRSLATGKSPISFPV